MEYQFDVKITIGNTGTAQSVPSVCRLDSDPKEVLNRTYFTLNVEYLGLVSMRVYGSCPLEEGDLFEVDKGDDVQRIYCVNNGKAVLIGSTFESKTWHDVYSTLLERTLKSQQEIAEENAKLMDRLEKVGATLKDLGKENANLRIKLINMDEVDKGDDVQRIYCVNNGKAVLIGSTFESKTWHDVYSTLLERTLKSQQEIAEENAKLMDRLEKVGATLKDLGKENANLRIKLINMDEVDKLHEIKIGHTDAIVRLDEKSEATDDQEKKIEIERKIAKHEKKIDEITELQSDLMKSEQPS